MAHKPSEKTHRMKPVEGLNLTPMIDMITNLMFFLMMFASVIPVAMIDAPLPKVASTADEVKMAKNDENKLELIVYINAKGFNLKAEGFGNKNLAAQGDKLPYKELHDALVQIKLKQPKTKEITLIPTDDTPYEVMVGVMDASRELAKGDQGYKAVPPEIAQKPESQQFNRLFPEVSIGGI
jgi:biopolymer transport protein ExbD